MLVALEDNVIVGSVMAGYDGHRGWISRIASGRSSRPQRLQATRGQRTTPQDPPEKNRKRREGDLITLDRDRRLIELHVSAKELAARKKKWKAPKSRCKDGILAEYRAMSRQRA